MTKEKYLERSLQLACKRLQWNPATPSAFVMSWANDISDFAAAVAKEARMEEAKLWEQHLRINSKFWGWDANDIKTPHPRITELEQS